MPGTMTLCELHGLPVYSDGEWHLGACATCYKWRGQCDFGGCGRGGLILVSALGPSEPAPPGSRDGGRVAHILDTRRACALHVPDILRGYHAAGVELCYLQSQFGFNRGFHRAGEPLQPPVGSPSRWWAAE